MTHNKDGIRPHSQEAVQPAPAPHVVSAHLPTEAQISDADLAEFKRLKALVDSFGTDANASRAARKEMFAFIMGKHHISKVDGKTLVHVNNEMRTYFSTYGFTSDAQAASFTNWVEGNY